MHVPTIRSSRARLQRLLLRPRRGFLAKQLASALDAFGRWRRGRQSGNGTNTFTIVVGGMKFGGSGKTAAVAWLADRLADMGFKVGLLVRPTRRIKFSGELRDLKTARLVGDEASQLFAGKPNRARIFAGADLADLQSRFGPLMDILIVDDGLRVSDLGVSVSVMMLDLGSDQGVFPMGPCRESISESHRFDIVWGHKCPLAGHPLTQHCDVVSTYVATELINGVGERTPLSSMMGKHVALASGIGDPESFYRIVHTLGCHVDRVYEFGDHERFDFGELTATHAIVLTTEKDLSRNGGDRNVLAVKVAFHFQRGRQSMETLLSGILEGSER